MSSSGYLDSMDIANRALFHVGAPMVLAVDEESESNSKCAFVYDKLRRAELRRNVWRFATRRAVLRPIDTTTRLLVPDLYSADITYSHSALARDANGVIWQSVIPDNFANAPHTTTAWEQYYGPLTVELYDSTDSYYSGELVYKAGTNAGSYTVYLSLYDGNEDVPSTANAWATATTYKADQVVSNGGYNWRSLIEFNTGVTPATAPADYDDDATYSVGNTVTASDGFKYTAVGTTTGSDPTTDGGVNWTNSGTASAWSRVPTNYTAATTWLPLFAAASSIHLRYPVGTGPVSQSGNRNVYRLPAGFLRLAPQNPKAGSYSVLGASSGAAYNDWEFEDNYLISADSSPLLFRFVADMTDVAKFDDMFCEGLACRMGIAVCEPLTQSSTKHTRIASEYNKFMDEARKVNAIEMGPEEAPVDDYIACRR